MRNEKRREMCRCSIGSVTQAMRAKRVLASASVFCEVVKADEAPGGEGCAYAISYACERQDDILGILQNAGITTHRVTGGGR